MQKFNRWAKELKRFKKLKEDYFEDSLANRSIKIEQR